MIRLTGTLLFWCSLYLVIALLPLAGGIVNLAHGRGFWLNLSIAFGFVSLSIFGLQFINVLRVRFLSRPVGMLEAFGFHRYMGYAGTGFAIAHLVILLAIDRKYWALLNLATNPARAKFAMAATAALLVLIVTTVWRQKLGIPYRRWHKLHWALALLVFSLALVHAVLVNYYLEDRLEQLIWISLGGLFVLAAIWARFINPILRVRQRWQVTGLTEAPKDVFELNLRAVGAGPGRFSGLQFLPGQFAWVVAGRSPFSISANPFSIASSAERPEALRFIIRANAGYTNALRTLKEGACVYLDGPYGTFSPDPDADGPLILIGAGVGVTPFLSMLETLADRRSARPCTLILTARSEQEIIGKDHIDRLQQRLPLTVHYHLTSTTGRRIDRQTIESWLPGDLADAECFICGATEFMNVCEDAVKQAGMEPRQVHAERFSMV